jgi:hypothetical protein
LGERLDGLAEVERDLRRQDARAGGGHSVAPR